MKVPTRVLLSSMAVVGACTAVLPYITGYGTILFQMVVLYGWLIVAKIASQEYADLHPAPVLTFATLLNLTAFLIPALVIWVVSSRRWPRVSSALLMIWALFYV